MVKRSEVDSDLRDLNGFLAEETADSVEMERIDALVESLSSVTKLLSALEEISQVEFEDEIGAALIKEFRVKFARHEMETL